MSSSIIQSASLAKSHILPTSLCLYEKFDVATDLEIVSLISFWALIISVKYFLEEKRALTI